MGNFPAKEDLQWPQEYFDLAKKELKANENNSKFVRFWSSKWD